MLVTMPLAIAGYAAIANVQGARLKYGMTFIMAMGMYGSIPCILVSNSNNSAGHYKRATTSAMQLTIANCGGFVASKGLSFFRSFLSEDHELTIPHQHLSIPVKTNRSITGAIRPFLVSLCFHGSCELDINHR